MLRKGFLLVLVAAAALVSCDSDKNVPKKSPGDGTSESVERFQQKMIVSLPDVAYYLEHEEEYKVALEKCKLGGMLAPSDTFCETVYKAEEIKQRPHK